MLSFVWAQFTQSQATGVRANALVGIVDTEIRGVLLVDFVRGVMVYVKLTPLTNNLQEPGRPTYRRNRLQKRTNTMLSKQVTCVGFNEKREAWST